MVSFNCQRCADVVKKPKVVSHAAQCGSGAFTCVDCMVTFDLNTIKNHTECISEVQRYQSKWQDKKHTIKASAEGQVRRPKFSANDFSDTDMDEDAKPLKRSRPETSKMERRGLPDSDDDDAVVAKPAPSKSTAAATKPKAATPKQSPKLKAAVPKLSPPAATVTVDAFELGSSAEVMELCVSAIAAAGETSLSTKALAKTLAHDIYAKRIEKRLVAALTTAFQGKAGVSGGRMSADGASIDLTQH